MFDVDSIKRQSDLANIVEADLGPPRRHNGRWLTWICPLHDDGDRDGGSLRVTPDTGTFFCFGCHKTGDVIAWLRYRQGLTFSEACEQLGGTPKGRTRQTIPNLTWQQAAGKVLRQAQQFLWSGGSNVAMDYLHQRGLTDETIKYWGLGFSPSRFMVPEIQGADGKCASIARGWLIPAYIRGELRGVKIRQPDGYNPKYVGLMGGKAALFGADTLTYPVVLLTEGEFDAMLAWQEVGDFAGVATTTGGAKTWQREWLLYLMAARVILVAYDLDATGNEAAAMITSLSSRAKRVQVPKGKDITEFWQSGGNIREWMIGLLPADLRPPEQPKYSCSVCSNMTWRWSEDRWICSVCNF